MNSDFQSTPVTQLSIYRVEGGADMIVPAIARRPLFQIVLVVVLAVAFTFAADWFMIRSLWNAIWIFAIPALVGITLNRGVARQLLMTFLLMTVSAFCLMATATYFGLGY